MNVRDIAGALEIEGYEKYIALVEEKMVDELRSQNVLLRDPVIKLIEAGGKRLRPLLLLASAAENGSNPPENVISAGAAIELLHVSSLIHDDIIDESDKRHGIDSANKQVGVNNALLSGDYALAASYQLACKAGIFVAASIGAAFKAMCEGQSDELASRFDVQRSVSGYFRDIHDKTAVLLANACSIGGSFTVFRSDVSHLYAFGEAFGMAFQLLDDLSDIVSMSMTDGKPVQHDLDEGIYTYPVLLAIKSDQKELLRMKPSAAKNLRIKKSVTQSHINRTEKEILKYWGIARACAADLKNDHLSGRLQSFADWFIDESLETLKQS